MQHKQKSMSTHKKPALLVAVFVVAFTLSTILMPLAGTVFDAEAAAGTVWTTDSDCGSASQDVNQYDVGGIVYINGENFDLDTDYFWFITGQPGGASADPGIVVASGSLNTDGSGNFCVNAYTVEDR